MKTLISIVFLNIITTTFAQTKPLVDTLIKFNENTYLVQKGNSLFGKPSVKYFFRFSEALNYPKKIMILEHAITKKRGVVNFEDSSVIVPLEYNYIRKTKDTNVVMLKNKIGIGLYFFRENKTVPALYNKIYQFKNSRNYLLLGHDSILLAYNNAHKLLNTYKNISSISSLDDSEEVIIESRRKNGVLNNLGKLNLPINYKRIDKLKNTNYLLGTDNGFIFCDSAFKTLTKVLNSYSYFQHNTMIMFSMNEKTAFYSISGKIKATIDGDIYYPIPINEEGDFFFKQNNLYGIVSYLGNIIAKPFLEEYRFLPGNRNVFEGKVNNIWSTYCFDGKPCKISTIRDEPPPPPPPRQD